MDYSDRKCPKMDGGGIPPLRLVEGTRIKSIEVYPHSGFLRLAGRKSLPKKASPAGAYASAELLRAAGLDDPSIKLWDHHSLDAGNGRGDGYAGAEAASMAGCGHDSSAIWLP